MSIIAPPTSVATPLFVGQPLPASLTIPAQRPLPATPLVDSTSLAATRAHPQAVQAVVLLLEICRGQRHVGQLNRLCTGAALRTAVRLTRLAGWDNARIASVHSCEPADGVIEAAAHIFTGRRSLAWAIRIERQRNWVITSLEVDDAHYPRTVRPGPPSRGRP